MPDDPLDAIDPEALRAAYPDWETRAAWVLDEVIAHDDENGALANTTGDDLRDALRLAANRLRDLVESGAVVPAPTYEAAVAALRFALERQEKCYVPMRGLYGAETTCARPARHDGDHDPIWDYRDWTVEGALAAHWALTEGTG